MSAQGQLPQMTYVEFPDAGLYYNSSVSQFQKEAEMGGKLRFVYLTSPPFSGSTLFSFLANTHPEIATVGEMTGPVPSQDPETYQCSCGERIRACPFWKQIAAQMKERDFSFDCGNFATSIRLGNSTQAQRLLSGSLLSSVLEDMRDGMLKLWPSQNRRLRTVAARIEALAESVLQVTQKSVFLDASKNPMTIRHLSRLPGIELRVVHLVRDVRGAAFSKRKNKDESNWNRAITSWVRKNRTIERQLQRLTADNWIRIRYEDICRAPADTMNRFFRFCGLQPLVLPQDFSSMRHHIVGNRMRLANFGQIQLDEAWRRMLTPEEVNVAIEIAGTMHLRYGYPRMSVADIER
jgi:hypothetical protein